MQRALGLDRMRQHNHALVQEAAAMLQARWGTRAMLGAGPWLERSYTSDCCSLCICPSRGTLAGVMHRLPALAALQVVHRL